MVAIVSGFATILIVIGTGWLAGKFGVLSDIHQIALSNLAFNIATPCLMFLVVARMDMRHGFGAHVGVSFLAAGIAGALYVALARFWWRPTLGETVLGVFSCNYVNAANLGLPIATYVLGDVTWMAPILLIQTALLQPLGVTILDVVEARASGRAQTWATRVTLPFRNPITMGAMCGLAANLAHWQPPRPILAPVELLAQISIPGMLVAFGVSMFHSPRLRRGPDWWHVWAMVGIKLIVMPGVAWALCQALRLPPPVVRACTVIAALPTAQNVFVISQRYGHAVNRTRDTIFVDTVLSMLVLFIVASLVGG